MNTRWGRGFFRIWLVLSVFWIAGWTVLFWINGGMVASIGEHDALAWGWGILLLPPVLLLLAGAAVGRAVRAFRQPK